MATERATVKGIIIVDQELTESIIKTPKRAITKTVKHSNTKPIAIPKNRFSQNYWLIVLLFFFFIPLMEIIVNQ